MQSTTHLRVWWAVHRWTSLVCTAFILLLCLTGLPLIFEDEIDNLIGDEIAAPALPAGQAALPLDRIVDAARQRYPQELVQFFLWDRERPELIKVIMAPDPNASREKFHRLVIDARTAQVLDEPPTGKSFTRILRDLHAELLLDVGGGLFLGAMGLLLVASIVSGVVLYGPYMRKLGFGTVRNARARRVRWLDLHNLLGIVTVAWLLVVGVTGAINTLAKPMFDMWRAQEMPRLLAAYRDRPAPKILASVDVAVASARRALPDMELASFLFPNTRFSTPRHYLIWTRGTSPLTSRLFTPVLIDAETGELASARPLPWYLRALELSRPLHFGDYGGLPLKIIWAVLDLMTIAVLVSGLYLWFARPRPAVIREPEQRGARPLPAE
jgi:uncharacterized iron-regulated membrane protein